MRLFDAGAREGPQTVGSEVLTVANLLSFARLAVLPVIYLDLVSGRFTRALVVMFVFGATDWFDGYLARRLDQVTRLGQLLDPISDRALVVVVGVGYVVGDVMPLWAVLVVLARDVLVMAVGGVLLLRGVSPPEVTRLGKAATFGLMWSIAFFLVAVVLGEGTADPQPVVLAAAWFGYAISIVLYWLAAAQYARELATSPSTP